MKFGSLIYIILISLSGIFGSKTIKQANKAYNKEAFRQAIVLFEDYKSTQPGEKVNADVAVKMANCYFFLNDFSKAKDFYELTGEANLSGQDKMNYGQLLFLQGDFAKAREMFESQANTELSKFYLDKLNWIETKKQDTSIYKLEKTDINTFGQSFGIQYYQGGVVFSSASDGKVLSSSADDSLDLKGLKFLNLYYSPLIENGEIGQPVLFSENLAFDYHVGAVTFSPDYKTMYYTQAVKTDKGESVLKVYSAQYVAGSWKRGYPLSFNSDKYSCAHPALSTTGDTLYFVSNMPDGVGGKDIWFAQKMGSYWLAPQNYKAVNTSKDELFPFVSINNRFYFSSNGHPGYGGLDVFELVKSDTGSVVENMKYGVNSRFDDFAFVLNPDNLMQGFVSSNRNTSGKYDNIFTLNYEEPIVVELLDTQMVTDTPLVADTVIEEVEIPMVEMLSTVSNALSGMGIPEALVVVTDEMDNSLIFEGISDELGRVQYSIEESLINPETNIHISVVAKGKYEPYEKTSSGQDFIDLSETFTDINLMPIIEETQTITIPQNKLNFALNSYELSYDAKKILERWYEYLNANRNVRLRLNAHTDAQGDLDYNLRLSQRRADNAKNYLVQRGIDTNRIISRGYGERYILNHCKDGVDCSDEEHEVNRRLEIIVIVD